MKLNYLIVMPRFMEGNEDDLIFPIGIAYVSAAMKQAGYNVHCLNLNLFNNDDGLQALKAKIVENSIDILLIGGLSGHYSIIRNIINEAKDISPRIRVIAGGGIITGDPLAAMEALELVEYGIIGEGEDTVCELAASLESEEKFEDIKGLIYRSITGQLIKNDEREDIEDLNLLPFPDYEGFDFREHVKRTHKNIENGTISATKAFNLSYIIASRSCPYQCTFCFHTCGKKYRQRTLDSVFEEIDYLKTNYDIKFISISDELFSNDRVRIREFCKRIKPYDIKWWAQFRVNTIDEEMVELIKNSNCAYVGLGIESADDDILKSMKKGLNVKQIEHGLELLYHSGISFFGSLIFGDKEETKESAERTLKWWNENLKYRLYLNMIVAYPGSEMYKYAIKNKRIQDPIKFLKDGCPQVNLSKMRDEEFAEFSTRVLSSRTTGWARFSDYEVKENELIAKCSHCGKTSTYEGVAFFSGIPLFCPFCGETHHIPLPKEITQKIEEEVEKALKDNRKIGVWGINPPIMELYNNSSVLKNPNVKLIDISKSKQVSKEIHIYSPEILKTEGITYVIVGVQAHITTIRKQIENEYKNVEIVKGIYELLRER